MKLLSFKTDSVAATKKSAALFAKEIKHSHLKSGGALVIGLIGELGSGKTTFIQGFARGLGIKQRLLSPTFLIVRSYKLKIKSYQLFHIDCYRIKKPKELTTLGFQKIIANPQNIVLIEWADKIKKLLPKKTVWLKFSHGQKENERIIYLKS